MNATITQSGALYALQHRHAKAGARVSTLRTSVGEFAFRTERSGCYLDLVVGNVRRVLGFYPTDEAALTAVKDRTTGFLTWDALERQNTEAQLRTAKAAGGKSTITAALSAMSETVS